MSKQSHGGVGIEPRREWRAGEFLGQGAGAEGSGLKFLSPECAALMDNSQRQVWLEGNLQIEGRQGFASATAGGENEHAAINMY